MIACHSLISRTALFGGNTPLVHHTRRREQVGRLAARVLERLDPRLEGLPRSVLGHEAELALARPMSSPR